MFVLVERAKLGQSPILKGLNASLVPMRTLLRTQVVCEGSKLNEQLTVVTNGLIDSQRRSIKLERFNDHVAEVDVIKNVLCHD